MKTAIVAMMLATVTVAFDVAIPTPAAAGWCIEACGLKRVYRPPPLPRTTTCTAIRNGNYRQTVCTSN